MADVGAIETSYFPFKEQGTPFLCFMYTLFHLTNIYRESALHGECTHRDEQGPALSGAVTKSGHSDTNHNDIRLQCRHSSLAFHRIFLDPFQLNFIPTKSS